MAINGTVTPPGKPVQANCIMDTNNSSIVSKRSVERLYHAEPHFYRYFVKKPRRRSPLINRGYWLRMHVVEDAVLQFLRKPSAHRKVVINLGCGYDPTPFQFLAKERTLCGNALFIDIDYPPLMQKKAHVIQQTPEILSLLSSPTFDLSDPSENHVQSAEYLTIGCDLADIANLDRLVSKTLELSQCVILCTAEVSITYMDTQAADALIRWAGSKERVRFVLLEQFLPEGTEHPFAQKMMHHFNNLQTPLRSILRYPQLKDQENRFKTLGWSWASASDLWMIWQRLIANEPEILAQMEHVEPFDEWEEFALFASHYFVLYADSLTSPLDDVEGVPQMKASDSELVKNSLSFHTALVANGISRPRPIKRRFGSIIAHEDYLTLTLGLGAQTRDTAANHFRIRPTDDAENAKGGKIPRLHRYITSRMCHTTTELANNTWILSGGRNSPESALSDCWSYDAQAAQWTRQADLPHPLYRHCACAVQSPTPGTDAFITRKEQGVLVYGGRSIDGAFSPRWYLLSSTYQWHTLNCQSTEEIPPLSGAMLVSLDGIHGILLGGMNQYGQLNKKIYRWTLDFSKSSLGPSIKVLRLLASPIGRYSRFGAQIAKSQGTILIIGGIGPRLIARNEEIFRIRPSDMFLEGNHDDGLISVPYNISGARPLLVGHSIMTLSDTVIILGGGAVCFSFGTYWNEEALMLKAEMEEMPKQLQQLDEKILESLSNTSCDDAASHNSHTSDNHHFDSPTWQSLLRPVPLVPITTETEFSRVVRESRPICMEGIDIGPCMTLWNFDYLKATVGSDRLVTVHRASSSRMDFLTKNFSYHQRPFGDFLDDVEHNGALEYLRSLSLSQPTACPANLAQDYPHLARDFILPESMKQVSESIHSSVLRISGLVNMWLHYDVMANILCQIRGSKRLILFPPDDVSLLSLPPGASSSSIDCHCDDVFGRHPALRRSHPVEVILRPGQILFIPPLWFHTACPLDNSSISVNVFFRNMAPNPGPAGTVYSTGRDVYGNRDIQAYEKGRVEIDRIAASFRRPKDGVPPEVARFYLMRLADELMSKAHQC